MKKVIDRASSRGYFNHGWLKTHHTFSFANYYNPERIHFGALRVLNDDSVDPSMGFDTHPHKNMEVISIPLKGYLRHGDSVQTPHRNRGRRKPRQRRIFRRLTRERREKKQTSQRRPTVQR